MKLPLVSVCLPSINTFPFLRERLDTILAQTYTNWELVVVDSFSSDGSWELFEKLAQSDKRVSIVQAPRGLYQSWNNCIQRATGEYVYIATSDDTMAPDCLEKMVAALEEHPECDLAQCRLAVIDPSGKPKLDYTGWQYGTVFGGELKSLLERPHIRRAPYDGLLHLTGLMVHLSVTELLIRRSLFKRVGEFETQWGSIGDRNWEMKAGLIADTVFVPDTWASWRVHPANASALLKVHSPDYCLKVEQMIEDAVQKCEPYLAPAVLGGLRQHWLALSRAMRNYYASLASLGTFRRRIFQLKEIYQGNPAARCELMQRFRGQPNWIDRCPLELKHWLEGVSAVPSIIDLGDQPPATSHKNALFLKREPGRARPLRARGK
jgi:glycosyltransferase involved in cell wall biosynthesis